ncbi:hypothetical protein ACWD0J_06560 [Streptomyces sp. NPDC003011]
MAFPVRLAPDADRVTIRPQDEYGLLDLGAFEGPKAAAGAFEARC